MSKNDIFGFEEATREQILVKMALCGPPGSGKTRSALGIATWLAKFLDLGDVFFIDSENRSSCKYALDPRSGKGFKFKAAYLPSTDYSPQTYMKMIASAERAGARIIIIDSISHAWNGVRGILEQVDALTEASNSKNAFSAGWRKATPIQRQFVQTILASPAHIIVTMRSDPEWVVQENERGKKEPMMIGLSPQQRRDIAFEYDCVLDINRDHNAIVGKTRCEELNENGGVWKLPGENVARVLAEWVGTSVGSTTAHSEPVSRVDGPALDAVIAQAVGVAMSADGADRGTKERAWGSAKESVVAWCRTNGRSSDEAAGAIDTLKAEIAKAKAAKATTGQANGAAAPSEPLDGRA